jgi:hypothetical protein
MSEEGPPAWSVQRILSASGIDRIKFGDGVVGKQTTSLLGLCVVCFATILAGAWLHAEALIYLGLAVGAGAFLYSSITSMLFADTSCHELRAGLSNWAPKPVFRTVKRLRSLPS